MPLVEITTQWTERRKAASVPGSFWDPERRAWVVETEHMTDSARVAALTLFPHLGDQLEAPASLVDQLRPIDLATEWADGRPREELLPNVEQELRHLLYPYQVADAAYLCARMRQDGGAYNGWSRGLGKTVGALVTADELGAERVIVVCPNSSKATVWKPEIEKWTPHLDPILVGGTKAQRDRAVAAWRMDGGVLIVHYEALRLIQPEKLRADLVIVDEAHRLSKGGPGKGAPQFYRALKKIKADYRLALSGSIIVNSPEDLFGVLHWLYPTRYASRWRDWNNRWISYIEGSWGKVMVGLKAGKLPELHAELASFLVVRRKEDELPGLPEKLPPRELFVELSPAQRKVYDDLQEKFMAELPDGKLVMSASVIAQLGKLRQIATGLDLLGETFTDSSKLDLCMDLITDNLPHKTVVFAWHRATVDALAFRLAAAGIPAVAVHGGVKMDNRTLAVEHFQNDPEVKVIIATIKTLGESVTLHAAADLIFVESSWTPADMEQAADRVYRIGQKRRVTITHLIAKDTVDQYRILPTVKSKAQMRNLVLGGAL